MNEASPFGHPEINRHYLAASLVFGGVAMFLCTVLMVELARPGISLFLTTNEEPNGQGFVIVADYLKLFLTLAGASLGGIIVHAIGGRSSPLMTVLSLTTTALVFMAISEVNNETISAIFSNLSPMGNATIGWVLYKPLSIGMPDHRLTILFSLAGLFVASTLILLLLGRGSRAARPYLIVGLVGVIPLVLLQFIIYLPNENLTGAFRDSYVDVALEYSIAAQCLLFPVLWASLSAFFPTAKSGWLGAVLLQIPVLVGVYFMFSLGRQGMQRSYIDYPEAFASYSFILSVSFFALVAVTLAIFLGHYIRREKLETVFE